MRRLFDRVTDRLRGFLLQRDFLALVVSIRDSDAPVPLKILESLDDASTSELFWTFTEPFEDAWSYASSVVAAFRTRYEPVRMALERDGGSNLWPRFPAERFEEDLAPYDRLRDLMVFSRGLLPSRTGTLSVWGFFPLSIAEPDGYARLMARVLEHQLPNPWCYQLRVFVRDDTGARPLATHLAEMEGLDWYEPDLSVEAMHRALEDDVDDEAMPLAQRMQSVLMSAGVDYAQGRHSQALEKYTLAFRYYEGTDNAPFAAIALNGMGEVHQALGDYASAGAAFESALGPATAGQPPSFPVLLNVLLNLANLRLAQEKWREAEAYYENAEQVATLTRNPPAKIQCLECLGYAKYQQQKFDEATDTWELGAYVAGELHEPELRRSILDRLQYHYKSAGNWPRLRDVERAIESLEAEPEA